MIPLAEARACILAQARTLPVEMLPLREAIGRTLARSIYADRDYPPYHRATMDGYAVHSADFQNCTTSISGPVLELVGSLAAGEVPRMHIPHGTCIEIMTGAVVPDDVDAVIKVEDTCPARLNNNKPGIKFQDCSIPTFHNIARRGEDTIQGGLLCPSGQCIDVGLAGVLASIGCVEVPLACLPAITIVATGDELVMPEDSPAPHQIRASNPYTLDAMLQKYKIQARIRFAGDSLDRLSSILESGLQDDILIVTGAVSMGKRDLVPDALLNLGVKKVFHKVSIKPGKPIWFGRYKDCTVFALPGNPCAVQVAGRIFIEPYLQKCMQTSNQPPMQLPLLKERHCKGTRSEFFFSKLIQHNNQTMVQAMPSHGSGDILAAIGSAGIAHHPEGRQHLKAHSIVEFYAW